MALLLSIVLPLTACGGKGISKIKVQNLIVELPDGLFNKDDIDIDTVSRTGGRGAVAEATVRAALRLEKVGSKWEIREIRIGNDQWEQLDHFLLVLKQVKTDYTRKLLEEVAAAAEKYHEKNGTLPEFQDYVSLSDVLVPDYLPLLIREDAWRNPLAAYKPGPNSLRLMSAGPDGLLGSADDIELSRSY